MSIALNGDYFFTNYFSIELLDAINEETSVSHQFIKRWLCLETTVQKHIVISLFLLKKQRKQYCFHTCFSNGNRLVEKSLRKRERMLFS